VSTAPGGWNAEQIPTTGPSPQGAETELEMLARGLRAEGKKRKKEVRK